MLFWKLSFIFFYYREERSPRSSPSRLPVNISRRIGAQSSVMAANGSASPPCAMKKSSSIQNISKQSLSVLRRAQSSQNVSNGGRDPRSSMRNRASTPSTALAYNAELLAIFEKEKKGLEGRISELVQITESRKAEIEKHKVCRLSSSPFIIWTDMLCKLVYLSAAMTSEAQSM